MKGKVRYLFIGLPLLVVVASAILPSTGWLVRLQVGLLASPRAEALLIGGFGIKEVSPEAPRRFRRILQDVAQRHPNDYPIQLGWALRMAYRPYENLKKLVPRFGDRPALYAHLLRFAVLEGVRPRRPEEAFIVGKPPSTVLPLPPPPLQLLAEFDRFAVQGEKLDPDNAYFPMMRAVGLFAARRDVEATETLLRAGKCSRWDDYCSDETLAQLALLRTVFGEAPVIAEEAPYMSTLFPHLSALRSLARLAVYMANKAEREGGKREAADIHLALLRCGSLMRVHATHVIGNLVGIAIISTATALPDFQPGASVSPSDRSRQIRRHFLQYLRTQDREADVRWVESEFRATDAQLALIHKATKDDTTLRRLALVTSGWAMSLFLLQCVLAMLMLWAIYTLLAHTSLRQGVEPYFALPIALLLIGTAVWLTRLPAGTAALFSALQSLQDQQQASAGWVSTVVTQISQWMQEASPPLARLLQVAAVLVVILLLTGVLFIAELFHRREEGALIVEGIHRNGLPLVGALLLLYALLVTYTAHVENDWKRGLMLRVQHEGKFLAQQVGKPWQP